MKYRKFLAILLALIMVIGLLPFAALADDSQDDQPGYTQGTDPTGDGNPEPEPEPESEPEPDPKPEPEPDLVPGVMLLNDTHGEGWTALTEDDAGKKLAAGKYYLAGDLSLSKISFSGGESTLCLCGHTLNLTSQSSIDGCIVYADTTLTIADCGGAGKITGVSGQVVRGYSGATVHLTGGTIDISGSSQSTANAISMSDDSQFYMSGGTLIGFCGVKTNGFAEISGGSIQATKYGVHCASRSASAQISGDVNITSESIGVFMNRGSLLVSGGIISGAEKGIYLFDNGDAQASLSISGGNISAGGSGYAVYHQAGSTLYLSGSASVSSLYIDDSTENIVYASKAGTAYTGTQVAVTLGSTPTTGTAVIQGISGNADRFTFTGDGYHFEVNDNGDLILTEGEPEPAGHTHPDDPSVTWMAWDGASPLNSAGYYYLESDKTMTTGVEVSADVTLCLYGNTLSASIAPMFTVSEGASLTICDCKGGGTVRTTKSLTYPSIIEVEGGSFTLKDGTIESVTCRGILLKEGSVKIEGGTIITGQFSGIYLHANGSGSIEMTGGNISYNSAAGIYCAGVGTVSVTGGNIAPAAGNTNADTDGILMQGGKLTVSDNPQITGSRSGILVIKTASAVITGGTISATASDGYGVNVEGTGEVSFGGNPQFSGEGADLYIGETSPAPSATVDETPYSGKEVRIYFDGEGETVLRNVAPSSVECFTLLYPEGKVITRNENGDLVITAPASHPNHGADGTGTISETWQVWNPKETPTISQDGYYYLNADYGFINSTITIDADVHLCLNGHLLKDNQNKSDFIVIKDGASLTICDCDKEGAGVLDYYTSGDSGYAINNSGDLTLYSGKINSMLAGGVWMPARATGTFTMEGGTIDVGGTGINNGGSASRVLVNDGNVLYGGSYGIFASGNGTTSISGGTIQPREDNTTGSGFNVGQYASTVLISAGTIIGNEYGVLIPKMYGTGTASYTISGGTITAKNGYGVQIDSGETVSLTGSPEITGAIADLYIKNPNVVKATKESAPYTGEELRVYFGGDADETQPIILDVTEDTARSFTLVSPADKILKLEGNNLVLGTETVGHPNHGINGEGSLPEGEQWLPWDGTQAFSVAFPANSDDTSDLYVYLTDDVTYSKVNDFVDIAPNNQTQELRNVHLCLNGHTISGVANGTIWVKANTALTICDCDPEKHGTIENTSTSFGYAAVLAQGDFTLYSGNLVSNKYGVKIDVTSSNEPLADFRMEGGSIVSGDNAIVARNKGKVEILNGDIQYGGIRGIFISDGTVHVSGGTIAPKADNSNDSAAGIGFTWNSSGKLYLTGDPSIIGKGAALSISEPNAVYASDGDNAYSGASLTVAFTEDDDKVPIILNVTDGNAGKFTLVSPADKTLVRQGNNLVLSSEPAGHQAHDATGTGTIPEGKEWKVWDGTTQMNTAGYYYLEDNVTLTDTIEVTKDVHLCLNGHSITAPEKGGASTMFKIDGGGKLSVCDCQGDGRIEMLRDSSNFMAIQVMGSRTFDLYGGTIYAVGSSRAVYSNGGTVNVYGGIVESASTINGALRADGKDAVVNLSGGEIRGAVTLRSGPQVYLSGSPELTTIDIKEESQVEKYAIQIHAASKDGATPYSGGAIEISTVETNLEPGHIVVYNVNNDNASKFTLKDNVIVRDGDNLVIAANSAIELTVTPPDFTYGDPNAVIQVTTDPEDATVTFERYIDDPFTLGTVDPNTGKLTGFDAGTFTVTVTATKDGFTAASETVTFTVKKKDVTFTPNTQQIDYSADIAKGTDQVTASGLVNGDALSEITLAANKTAKTITASDAVIKNGNRDVNKNYNITYEPGTLTLYNVPQAGFAITGQPEAFTYGDTFTLTATGGSGTGAVTWEATGAATVDQSGNVTITGVGSFTITAKKAADTTYQAAQAEVTGTADQKAITITAKDQRIAYEATITTGVQQVEVSTVVTGDTLYSIDLTASNTAITPSNAVIKKGDANVTTYYTITYEPGTLTFYNVPQEDFAITGQPKTVTYGDTFTLNTTGGSGTGAVTWGATGTANVDQYGNVTITSAGSFTITATKAGDDTFAAAAATYQGTAQKRALTITADDETIAFNAAAPSYTATVTGAVQADEAAIVAAYTLTSTYVKGNPVGNYPITVTVNLSADLQAKYNVTKKDGTLHVVETMAEVVKAPDAVRNLVYTGKSQKLVTPGTAKNGTMVYSLDGKNYSETVPTATNAGTYTVWYKVVGNSGYSDTAVKSFNVTIKKAALTVTADDIWVYAGDAPKFTATIKGYVNGEDWRVLGGKLTFTCGYSEKYSKPGSRYTITPKGLTADNYEITFKTGTLTVKDPLSPRFNVYVLESKHGTVEADCRYARKGDVVTLTIKPDWGYELETLTVTDSHGYALKLTYHNNGTYTFTMPRDNVTVKAVFTVRDMPFVDVPGDAWYAGGVRYVYAHGLMNGTGSWRFSPNLTTTRAMIATILYRMEGSPRVYGTSQFTDVKAGSWYEDAVIWATQNDIVEGYTSKSFGPNDPITREQMAAMLYRYADYCRCDMSAGRYIDLSKYSDMNEISAYAIPALRWAVGEGIIEGRTGKRLAPTDTATRAEVAMMLMRFCEDVIW